MKRPKFPLVIAVATAVLLLSGCGRQTRGSADAYDESRVATPAEGGSVSTAGSAGDSKSFGDTQAKTRHDGVSPSESPTGRSQDVVSPKAPAAPVTPPVKEPPQP